jgi:ribosome-binding factor A
MTRKRPSRRQMQSLCAEFRDDDGIDPREFFKPSPKRKCDYRKDLQLCRQVAETLSLVLSGELNDDVLRDVQVVAVTPAPNASQLLVLVSSAPGETPIAEVVLERLSTVAGRLRAEVASAITRRRAPKLLFQFVSTDLHTEAPS